MDCVFLKESLFPSSLFFDDVIVFLNESPRVFALFTLAVKLLSEIKPSFSVSIYLVKLSMLYKVKQFSLFKAILKLRKLIFSA